MPKEIQNNRSALEIKSIISKNSNSPKIKKQVRFADSEGKGPLIHVLKVSPLKKPKQPKKMKKKAEQVNKSKNS